MLLWHVESHLPWRGTLLEILTTSDDCVGWLLRREGDRGCLATDLLRPLLPRLVKGELDDNYSANPALSKAGGNISVSTNFWTPSTASWSTDELALDIWAE